MCDYLLFNLGCGVGLIIAYLTQRPPISDLLGQETLFFQTMGRSLGSKKSRISYSEQHILPSHMGPDEVPNLPGGTRLAFLAGQRPIIGLYDAH